MIYLILYILIVILQIWFVRNTTINLFNHEITYCKWEESCTYDAMPIVYLISLFSLACLLLEKPKYWTLKYIKLKS